MSCNGKCHKLSTIKAPAMNKETLQQKNANVQNMYKVLSNHPYTAPDAVRSSLMHTGLPSAVSSPIHGRGTSMLGDDPTPPPKAPTAVMFVDALATGDELSITMPGSSMTALPYATQSVKAVASPVPSSARLYCAVTGESFALPDAGTSTESGGFVYIALAHGDVLFLVRCARVGDPDKDALCDALKKTVSSAAVKDPPRFGAMVVVMHNLKNAVFKSCGGTLTADTASTFMDSILWCDKPQGTLNGTAVDLTSLASTSTTLSGTTIAASSPGLYTAGGVNAPAALFVEASAGGTAPVLDAEGLMLAQGDLPAGQIMAINAASSTSMSVSGTITSVSNLTVAPLAGGNLRTFNAVPGAKGFVKQFQGTVKSQKNNVVVTWGAAMVIVEMGDTAMPVTPISGRGAGYFAPVPSKNHSAQDMFGGILYGVRNTLFVLPNSKDNADAMVGAVDPYTRAMRFKTPFLMRRVLGLPLYAWFLILVAALGFAYMYRVHEKHENSKLRGVTSSRTRGTFFNM